jgi:hypothetical protein
MKNSLTLKSVKTQLAVYGVTIRKTGFDSELIVKIGGSPKSEGYFTNDLNDALSTGLLMATHASYANASKAFPVNV